jgi:aspartyl-tRNA(Asn)/glutamyl-tRNA(Gln) amidotransferase subunit B
MELETVIGLEVHAQLLTESKMFCTCSADYASTEPNTHVCPVCLGMPGVLPVINRKALEYTVMTALALNCTIPAYTKFDRKNYPYPDLVKGYQISQYEEPVGIGGWLDIEADGQKRRAGITRVHLEEDTAKLTHRSLRRGESYSLVDVNRAGVPLMEIVGDPDLRSPEEARQYLIKLRAILQFLGVSTGNMEEGSFRCDANISIRAVGGEHSVKVEVKNMNSFKAVYRALQYEEQRQRRAVEAGERLTQETRGWMEDKGITVSQRSKEYAHDYRYFPEPDLPPMAFERDWVEGIRARLPELPEARRDRFVADYGLTDYDASLLTISKATADYFETCLGMVEGQERAKMAKAVSNWMLGEFARLLNATDTAIEDSRVKPILILELIKLVDSGKISVPTAKSVFEEMFHSGKSAAEVVEAQGLTQISDDQEIGAVVDKVIAANAKAADDFKQGKEQALKFLVGQVMRETKGRANHAVVTKLLIERLGE